MYPKDVGIDVKYQINRRRISCNLLGMLIYTSMARREQNADMKVRICIYVEDMIIDFSQENILPRDDGSIHGHSKRHGIILKYIGCHTIPRCFCY
jgi:hypothetical protein